MGWEDRPYYRDRGAASNPLAGLLFGSVPLFNANGVRVRAHASLPMLIALNAAISWHHPSYWIASSCALVLVLLLHEAAHTAAAHVQGGDVEEILLWPAGGLLSPRLPRQPWPNFVVAFAGPAANLFICVFAALAVWALTPGPLQRLTDPHASHVLISFNPFRPMPPAALTFKVPAFYFWWLFVVSYVVLLVNLIPALPLDGGHMLQAVLLHVVGPTASKTVAAIAGMTASAIVMIVGLINLNALLICLTAWTFYHCYHLRMMQHESASDDWEPEPTDFGSTLYGGTVPESKPRRRRLSKRAIRAARRRHREEELERQRVDSILAKVSAQGLASLTWRERRVLKKATAHQRQRDLELSRLENE
jgi:Zn-dependent protease